jgi:hypothetical protein
VKLALSRDDEQVLRGPAQHEVTVLLLSLHYLLREIYSMDPMLLRSR